MRLEPKSLSPFLKETSTQRSAIPLKTGRYDKFDPDDKVDHNEWTGLTTTFVFPFENIRFYLEAQRLTTKRSPVGGATLSDSTSAQVNAMIRFAF